MGPQKMFSLRGMVRPFHTTGNIRGDKSPEWGPNFSITNLVTWGKGGGSGARYLPGNTAPILICKQVGAKKNITKWKKLEASHEKGIFPKDSQLVHGFVPNFQSGRTIGPPPLGP